MFVHHVNNNVAIRRGWGAPLLGLIFDSFWQGVATTTKNKNKRSIRRTRKEGGEEEKKNKLGGGSEKVEL